MSVKILHENDSECRIDPKRYIYKKDMTLFLFFFAEYPAALLRGDEGEENNSSEARRRRAKEGIRLRKNSARDTAQQSCAELHFSQQKSSYFKPAYSPRLCREVVHCSTLSVEYNVKHSVSNILVT